MDTTAALHSILTPAQTDCFHREGYVILPGLFAADEVAELRSRFERLADNSEPAPSKELWTPDWTASDPLLRYPRVMMPHRWDTLSRRWLLDIRSTI